MRKTFLFVLTAVALSACGSGGYVGGLAMFDDEWRAKAFAKKCQNFGYQLATPEFAECQQNEERLWHLPD